MTRIETQSAAAIPLILLIGSGIAWAGSQHGLELSGRSLFALCGLLSLVINWIVFIPSYLLGKEDYFDLTGSVTYVSLIVLALAGRADADPRSLLIGALIAIWAIRLGSFLFIRVRADGGDGRFDQIKRSFPRFFMTWTLQALWVFLTAACGLAAMTSADVQPLGLLAIAGLGVWLAGFAIEVVADAQKRRFRRDPRNAGRFIESGVWAWSRHPNYFGEITLWTGIALIALPVLTGWQLVTLVSPVFVYVLLTRISGVPLLEARSKKRWGEDPDYLEYVRRTSVLVPRPPRAS